ncbi:putative ubiquitin-protein ligase E3 component (UBR1) [Aspergillus saccharolyticus JOP 1030-1]|uniref:E3 ubiquitin-protein ligase n=1 Tax=Aspergillus saccharolyticus JOP 1030-1 TaxID=1450539 RepID=A0A318Z2D6_9EURO|nr:ubiquitin-protein ligase E3 component [Aspergillus saccharolyticus JOP 1030-1]PYH41465.1 ubiquitin-protein ligase E3 component [Aspergillus saccharolyticus JOP 1030-1]
MMLTECERFLSERLLRLPSDYNNRYGPEAEKELLEILFRSLTAQNDEYLRQLFPHGLPTKAWKLAEAQGAEEGAEYTEAARGKRCGHIFRAGEATYRCITCAMDDTCVLCSRCFDASDHTGHQYQISLSSGNCGCCDCGDEEAWRLPLFCAIHTDSEDKRKGKQRAQSQLPPDWVKAIRLTISRALDYFCDVISCSPEQLRLPKTEEGIRKDEEASRLRPGWYGAGDEVEEEPEYALALWNDEKHTIKDVATQVTRACRETNRFGYDRAHETNDIGRSVVKYSRDLPRLLDVSRVIEHIRVTVTIRSARDTFREQMCATIVEWLLDISGCSVGDDNEILRHVICEELLTPWKRGSGACNADIGLKGIDDHQLDEGSPWRTVLLTVSPQVNVVLAAAGADDDDEDEDVNSGNEQEPVNDDEEAEEFEEYLRAAGETNEEDDEGDMELEMNRLGGELDDDNDMIMGDADDALQIAQTIVGIAQREQRARQQREQQSAQSQLQQERRGQEEQGAEQNDSNHGDAQPTAHEQAPNDQHERPPTSLVPIPKTPSGVVRPSPAKTPIHWQYRSHAAAEGQTVPVYEDLRQRTRLDWMILFDLRLWKKTRTELRDLYIGTVVNVPQFKRIMGLRLSALYTALAQLYLIADREPDHSIVNLSLQLLTTPSITEEILLRGNFLTKVMAILYTFLTTRQVGEPHEVNPNATLAFDAGSVTNRRLYHFFLDLRYLLQSEYVQNRVRAEEQYLAQFLDLVKLSQGICPNVRAVGEHVEYETDAWISASVLMREINRLCRQFCEAFRNPEVDGGVKLLRAIRTATISAVVHSYGLELKRFSQAEIKDVVSFKTLPPFDFEVNQVHVPRYRVVDFVVERGWMSFHHALHYTTSWLLECARNVSGEVIRDVLVDAAQAANDQHIHDPQLTPEDLLLSMFDYPLRVCAWLAQMKAGMWVRNGLSLRHQMSQYRGVSSRDFAYYRDIFLLQTALVTCDPSRVLASIADRFGMVDWMNRDYVPRSVYEDQQIVDVAEEFVHLLILLLTDRTSLTAIDDSEAATRESIIRDIAHVLCFKPLSFSDLSTRLSDKPLDSDMFQDVLEEIARFRPPEGVNDTGTFVLKPEYIGLVDPYSAHYSKNQREDAENIYREWMANQTGKNLADVVFEPKLRPITSGAFSGLNRFTRTLVFAQLVHHCLDYVVSWKERTPQIESGRIETFLQVVLHLILVASLEDNSHESEMSEGSSASFISHALTKLRHTSLAGPVTIVGLLEKISRMSEFDSCGAKIRNVLKHFWQKRPKSYAVATLSLNFPFDRFETRSPAVDIVDLEKEAKKRQASERKAQLMAQMQQQAKNFLDNQTEIDWGVEDSSDNESEIETATESQLWKYPSGTCMLCQEATNDSRLYGTFALVQDSTILRLTDVSDADWVREAIRTPTSLDKSANHLRPFGVAGENRTTVRRLDSTGGEVISEKVGLSKGFKAHYTYPGPVTTGCGHMMHYSCFEQYLAATGRRHHQQVARAHPESLVRKEFVCPLCKALGNAFLPIIWRGKEVAYPGALGTAVSFDEFINFEIKSIFSQPRNYALLTENNSNPQTLAYQEHFVEYLDKTLVPPLTSHLGSLALAAPHSLPSSPHSMALARIPMPDRFPPEETVDSSPAHSTFNSIDNPLHELLQIYQRLKQTLRVNRIPSTFNHAPGTMDSGDLVHTDSLFQSFGFSIAAVEIAQRGVESNPGMTLLDKISPLTLTHLRVLAETAFSYAALGSLQNGDNPHNLCADEVHEMHRQKICQLLIGHPYLSGTALLRERREIEPLLSKDIFVFLADCSVSLLPTVPMEIRHLVQMCYVAEIVKVAITYILWPAGLQEEVAQHGDAGYMPAVDESSLQFELTRHFFNSIVNELRNNIDHDEVTSFPTEDNYVEDGSIAPPEVVMTLRRLLSSYALTFLRKVVILLHVQHGVEFPPTSCHDVDAPELDRLTRVLRLPSLDEIFGTINDIHNRGSVFDSVIAGWIHHWNVSRPGMPFGCHSLWPGLPHPGIFELVGLPKYFDNLIDEANRRRCPKSKKELMDPCICLFCGDIFCSQAVCCMDKNQNLGGCNQHVPKCGKYIGLFLNIRKCMIIYLHNRVGSWHHAPYLDRHGEVDPGLRRNRQLILNQTRYDRLARDVWLGHQVPTTICRKLEADINNGGWETM